MSFHACGGNVGDNAQIPLPQWVLQVRTCWQGCTGWFRSAGMACVQPQSSGGIGCAQPQHAAGQGCVQPHHAAKRCYCCRCCCCRRRVAAWPLSARALHLHRHTCRWARATQTFSSPTARGTCSLASATASASHFSRRRSRACCGGARPCSATWSSCGEGEEGMLLFRWSGGQGAFLFRRQWPLLFRRQRRAVAIQAAAGCCSPGSGGPLQPA